MTPGRLNRLAVLFRFFLLIPCWIVQAVVSYGALTIFMFVTWLIVLVTGQMPDAIHQGWRPCCATRSGRSASP